MFDLNLVPTEVLSFVLVDLSLTDNLNLNQTNRLFRQLTLPLIYKDAIHNKLKMFAEKNKPLEEVFEVYRMIRKYNQYITKSVNDPYDYPADIAMFTHLTIFKEKVIDSSYFKKKSDDFFKNYLKLEKYTLRIKEDFDLDTRLYSSLKGLRSLALCDGKLDNIAMQKLNCKNLSSLKFKNISIGKQVITWVHENFPNLKCLKFVYCDISPESSKLTFPNITELTVKSEGRDSDWAVEYFTDSSYFPNVRNLTINSNRETSIEFEREFKHLIRMNACLHNMDNVHIENYDSLITLKSLNFVFTTTTHIREIQTLFETLVNLKHLVMIGSFWPLSFDFEHKLQLHSLVLGNMLDFNDEMINFLRCLPSLRKLHLAFSFITSVDDIYINPENDVTFPNLLDLLVVRSPKYVENWFKSRAPHIE